MLHILFYESGLQSQLKMFYFTHLAFELSSPNRDSAYSLSPRGSRLTDSDSGKRLA